MFCQLGTKRDSPNSGRARARAPFFFSLNVPGLPPLASASCYPSLPSLPVVVVVPPPSVSLYNLLDPFSGS